MNSNLEQIWNNRKWKWRNCYPLIGTLSTTFAKSSICTMKRQRNPIFHFTYNLNSLPMVCHNKLFCNHVLGYNHVLGRRPVSNHIWSQAVTWILNLWVSETKWKNVTVTVAVVRIENCIQEINTMDLHLLIQRDLVRLMKIWLRINVLIFKA